MAWSVAIGHLLKYYYGDSDVGDIVMLVTLWWWLIWDVGDFLYVLNRSSTFWIGHQHLKIVTNTFGLQHLSPTSM